MTNPSPLAATTELVASLKLNKMPELKNMPSGDGSNGKNPLVVTLGISFSDYLSKIITSMLLI